VIDVGTGDGRFVYQSARRHPYRFYIGIDANARPLEKISEKIHRSATKGGLPNVLFVQAAVEDLPSELDGVGTGMHIQFPWGSLLRAVAIGDEKVLRNLRRLCADGAALEILMGLDPTRDRSEIERLGLESVSSSYVDDELAPHYRAAGFEIIERRVMLQAELANLKSSWAKRLRNSKERQVHRVLARATETDR